MVVAHDLEVSLFLYLSVISAGTPSNQDIFFHGGKGGNVRFNPIGTQHWLVN